MAENNSIIKLTESALDENENPSLRELSTPDSKAIETNDKFVDGDSIKISIVSPSGKNKIDAPQKIEELSHENNTSLTYLENGGTTSTNFAKNNLSESLNNNNLVNGSYESNISFPDANMFLVENSPCSGESKKFDFSSDSNVNVLLDTSLTSNHNITDFKQDILDNINDCKRVLDDMTDCKEKILAHIADCKQENHALESDLNGLVDSKVEVPSASNSVSNAFPENIASNSVSSDLPENSASNSVSSALPENSASDDFPAFESRPLEEAMPAQIFEFLKPNNVNHISENEDAFTFAEDNDGETFQDAVQFFKDPSSLQFLDNMNSAKKTPTYMPRDSLYMKFDPLHKDYTSQPLVQESSPSLESSEPPLCALDRKDELEGVKPVECENDGPLPVNKPLADMAKRESFGNILISFDSPMKTNSARSSQNIEASPFTNAPTLYTEEELHQAIKISELTIQESYLKKQKEMEEDAVKKLQEKDETIKKSNHLCKVLHETVEELVLVLAHLKQENEVVTSKFEELETEKKKLDSDLKTSTEDLQSVEHTFSDFHKRYVQCKDMLKTYKDNEDRLKEEISSLHKRLEEQEQMYDMLQAKTEEIVDKANAEVANAKKGSDAQVAVLKAQLKKSELKISSLESDLKQVKIENDKLSGICDDLMAKVSET